MPDAKPLILCIDDDPDILSFLQIVLEAEGYEFAGARSAEEGLRVYKRAKPALIIVDLMMEEIDAGTDFVRELKILGNRAPVYMLSSVGDNLIDTIDYSELGLAGVFQKPLSTETLRSVLKAKVS